MELDRLEAGGCDAITNDIGRAKINPADLEAFWPEPRVSNARAEPAYRTGFGIWDSGLGFAESRIPSPKSRALDG